MFMYIYDYFLEVGGIGDAVGVIHESDRKGI